MFQVVHTVRQESGDMPTDTRELQVSNFIGPTLVDLGLYAWMERHGGMVSPCIFDHGISVVWYSNWFPVIGPLASIPLQHPFRKR